jgi:hypothetical protein
VDDRTLARFLGKVNQHGPLSARRPDLGPCWLWKPAGSIGGYGQFGIKGKMRLAHRVSHEHFNGAIPPKWTVDHLCCIRNCVRPGHLEAVTLAENLRRARAWDDYEGPGAYNRSKTHCPNGHPYSGDNLHVRANGKRDCRACARERAAWRRAQQPKLPRKIKDTCVNGHSFDEHGVIRGGVRVCAECARDRVRAFRERQRELRGPVPVRETCAHGHPWLAENIYVNPVTGQRACRPCHNARTLAAYHARRAAEPPKPPPPPREVCANGHPWIAENLFQTAKGFDRCRLCRQETVRRHEAKRSAERAAQPKPPRTTCRKGHDLTGPDAYVSAGGHRTCRECSRLRREERAARIAAGGPAVLDPRKGSAQREQTHCKHGHEFTPENTIARAEGGRKCRECGRIRSRERMRAIRAKAKADAVTC